MEATTERRQITSKNGCRVVYLVGYCVSYRKGNWNKDAKKWRVREDTNRK